MFGLAHLLWSRFRIAIRLNSGKAVDLLCYLILVLMFTLELHQYGDERSRLLTRIESVHESLRYLPFYRLPDCLNLSSVR